MSKRTILQYEPHQMEEALQSVKDGMNIKQAAERHGVPRNTLSDKVKGKTPVRRKMGPDSWLTKEEESVLVEWALSLCKAGFPITMEDLQNSVQQLTKELRRPFPFKGGRPGRKWCSSFLKRNPGLSLRTPQNLTSSRAAVSQEQITAWFAEVFKYVNNNNLKDVLLDPRRIFNGDETAFFLNPKGNKVLAKKGDKSIYQQVNSDEKECLTVLLTGNASGNLCPPLVCFKYERLPQDIVAGMPAQWGIGKSPSGWMTSEVFFEFLSNIFHPWLVEKAIPLPVVLFIDGHSSHLTLSTSKFCDEHGIVLVALFPNATHILQPMDVGVFKPLKSGWKTAVHEWRIQRVANKEDPTLKKKEFPNLLKTAIEKAVSPENVQHAFRKCGIFPWNPTAVDVGKLVSMSPSAPSTPTSKHECPRSSSVVRPDISTKLGTFLGKDKLKLFETSEDVWLGDVKDTSIFEFWKHIKSSEQAEINSSIHSEVPPSPQIRHTTPDPTSAPSTPTIADRRGVSPDPISGPSTTTDNQPSTSTGPSVTAEGKTIPSPFKRALFWPGPQKPKMTKRAPPENFPTVASSKAWQDYFSRKENIKMEMQKKKEERAAERMRKRMEKEKLKSLKAKKRRNEAVEESSSEEEDSIIPLVSSDEWNEPHTEEDGVELEKLTDKNLRPGSFALVTFTGGKRGATKYRYVCIVQDIDGEEVKVMGMRAQDSDKKGFISKDDDVSFINKSQIEGILPTPTMNQQGARVRYIFNGPVDVREN